MISYVFTKFGNKLNVDIFLTILKKNGMVENDINLNSPQSKGRRREPDGPKVEKDSRPSWPGKN